MNAIQQATMPGDDLLFRALRHSTIGAIWFHGRVRDGIGWVTDAMATKQWGLSDIRVKSMCYLNNKLWCSWAFLTWVILLPTPAYHTAGLSLTVRTLKREQNY